MGVTCWINANGEPPVPPTLKDRGYVKVVRCKDCIYMEKMDVDIGEGDLIWCSVHEFVREKDYYCADGKRKGN